MTVQSENYITIQGWMVTELKLSGNDLLVYAIIYGYSQDGQSCFYGSRQYLADWCNCTVRGIQKNLSNLIELGLIETVDQQSGYAVKYKANRHRGVGTKFTGGCEQSSQGEEQSSPDNINNNIDNINNTILKNSTAEPSDTNDQELTNTIPNRNGFSDGTKVKRKIFMNDDFSEKQKEEKTGKRLNMYDKCLLAIDEYTKDEKLKEALKTYLGIRLRVTEKNKKLLGVGQWKGLLNKLDEISGNKVAIVEQSIERGWASFFPISNSTYYTKPANNKDKFAENCGVKSVRPESVEGGNFSGQIF